MDSKTLYIGLVVILIAVGLVAYFDYTIYTEKQMQTYMIQSMVHNNTALSYNSTYSKYVNSNDYDNAIKTAQITINEFQQALDDDKKAMNYASGVHKDYLTYDIIRLDNDIKLYQLNIQALNYAKDNDIKGILSLANDIKKYGDTAKDYRNKEDEILVANQDKFKFLNS